MRMTPFLSRFLKGDDLDSFKKAYQNADWVRKTLLKELEERTSQSYQESEGKAALDRPNYAVTQAYLNGHRQGIKAAMQLLNLDQGEQ